MYVLTLIQLSDNYLFTELRIIGHTCDITYILDVLKMIYVRNFSV